jgi:hypothetical protein
MDICLAVNRAVRTPDGDTAFCILAAAATRDILLAKGWNADVLRVEAAVIPADVSRYVVILGGDGDGTRRPAVEPGRWRGHLVAIAEGRFDPTLDQTGLAQPMVIEVPDWWFAGKRPIFVPINGGKVRYKAFPGRGGFKSAPHFRPCWRREIVDTVVNQLGCNRPDPGFPAGHR